MNGKFLNSKVAHFVSAVTLVGLWTLDANASHYQCRATRLERATVAGQQEFGRDFSFQVDSKPIDCVELEKVKGSVCWDSNRNEIRLLSSQSGRDQVEASSLRVSKAEELPTSFTLQMETEGRNNATGNGLSLTCKKLLDLRFFN